MTSYSLSPTVRVDMMPDHGFSIMYQIPVLGWSSIFKLDNAAARLFASWLRAHGRTPEACFTHEVVNIVVDQSTNVQIYHGTYGNIFTVIPASVPDFLTWLERMLGVQHA